ncbi:Restriction endonuclease [Desulfotomaculum arcticum]|uniref:Restriction endonuclease n=1 Tax=Desulfotruncus arcticus DSM 17038 TaxID=1121424 RepID=A0A1I2XBY6_9FIRM|nr:restriction endonuclease [Desulfotruncus arcticus]SFH10519.1 Restriction endonuclease [Desulfotomaculum arcticum] [Desulfotruncus arcticus DSM 17038]
MPEKFGIEIPRIENEDIFEDLCLDLFKANSRYENTQRNGRRGQRQDGVDIFARKNESSEWIGVQCKVKMGEVITSTEIGKEVEKALKFNPKLTHYLIYTTAKRDAQIQQYVREKTNANLEKSLFDIQICFWEDIQMLLNEDKYKVVHYKYYREFYTNIRDDGYSFGKLISLTVGYHNDRSNYELLIGKTYQTKGNGYDGLDYWKNVNFIMNMNERTFETFPQPCFPSDLVRAISNNVDRYIICEWLNSIDSIDKFINSSDEEYAYLISDKQIKEYLSSYNEE